MRREVIKRVGVVVAVFVAGVCIGVVVGVYVAWMVCLNLGLAILLLMPGAGSW